MLSKNLVKKLLPMVILLSSGAYIISLGLKNDIDLYIHPRYILFTLAMSVLCVLLVAANHYFNKPVAHHKKPLANLPIALILVAAILFPARSLTSSTVSQRSVSGVGATSQQDSLAVSELFAGSSKVLSLNDWARLLATNTDESYYANKTAKISGFVYDADLGANTVWLARFVVTCCAVDAQPVGVPVQIESWEENYEEDSWVEVEGQFELAQTAGGEQLVLKPVSLTQIEEPENPYAN